MEGYFTKSLCGESDKSSKGRLRIEATNVPEFYALLEQAEKETRLLNEALSKLRRFEFDIDFSVAESISDQ